MNRKRWTLLACLMAVAITCLTLIARGQDGQRRFPDVPADHRYADAIQTAAEQEWIRGYADGTFQPDKPVSDGHISSIVRRRFPDLTRAEMAGLITADPALRVRPEMDDWYPNPDWKLENHQSIGGQHPMWSALVIVPIIPDNQIRWHYRIPGYEWISSGWTSSNNQFRIDYGPEQLEQGVTVIVQYQNDDTRQRLQITRYLFFLGCHPNDVCWHPEFSICVSDVAIYDKSCWITDL